MILKPKIPFILVENGEAFRAGHTILAPIKTYTRYTGSRKQRREKTHPKKTHYIRRGDSIIAVFSRTRRLTSLEDLIGFPKKEKLSNTDPNSYLIFKTFKFTKR
jgi:hypothetical protein